MKTDLFGRDDGLDPIRRIDYNKSTDMKKKVS